MLRKYFKELLTMVQSQNKIDLFCGTSRSIISTLVGNHMDVRAKWLLGEPEQHSAILRWMSNIESCYFSNLYS